MTSTTTSSGSVLDTTRNMSVLDDATPETWVDLDSITSAAFPCRGCCDHVVQNHHCRRRVSSGTDILLVVVVVVGARRS